MQYFFKLRSKVWAILNFNLVYNQISDHLVYMLPKSVAYRSLIYCPTIHCLLQSRIYRTVSKTSGSVVVGMDELLYLSVWYIYGPCYEWREEWHELPLNVARRWDGNGSPHDRGKPGIDILYMLSNGTVPLSVVCVYCCGIFEQARFTAFVIVSSQSISSDPSTGLSVHLMLAFAHVGNAPNKILGICDLSLCCLAPS